MIQKGLSVMLTNYEKETYFNFNEAEKEAVISTYNSSLIRKLKNAMGEYTEIKLVKDNPDGYCEFIIPKKWCKVSFPRILSDEQKAKMAEHLKAARTLRW